MIRIWARPASEGDETLMFQVDDDEIYVLRSDMLELEYTEDPVTQDWVELVPQCGFVSRSGDRCQLVAHDGEAPHTTRAGCSG